MFVAVGAIVEREGKILLVQEHKPGARYHGKWNQPAGWLEPGEDPVLGVVREVKEETGFDFTPTELLGIYSAARGEDVSGQGAFHCVKFLFRGTIGTIQDTLTSEVAQVGWFKPEEIYAMNGETLRNPDIKIAVKDFMVGKRYPLALVSHNVVQ